MSASADGSVPIGIGEAAGATVEERRDAHEVSSLSASCPAPLDQRQWPVTLSRASMVDE